MGFKYCEQPDAYRAFVLPTTKAYYYHLATEHESFAN